jgi:hypothetical protein
MTKSILLLCTLLCAAVVAVPTGMLEVATWSNGFCSGAPAVATQVKQGACTAYGKGLFAQYNCVKPNASTEEGHYCVGANLATNISCASVVGIDAGVCGFCYPRGGGSYEKIVGCPAGKPEIHSGCNDTECNNCARRQVLTMGSCFELSRLTPTPDFYAFGGFHPCGVKVHMGLFKDSTCRTPLEAPFMVPGNQCFNAMAISCPAL